MSPPPILITGGAGFIGTNLAHRLLSDGRRVHIFDNLSRPGVQDNLRWLRATHGDALEAQIGDVRDAAAVRRAVDRATAVFHFAAQVAVTTSLTDPRHDFEVNAGGTLNLLEALRARIEPPPIVFTSTNKVYGALPGLKLRLQGRRYLPADRAAHTGIAEEHSLDFHSPYGCSKGAADQYVTDYARTFGLPAVVLRMSCIYGPHQCGTEDQGWVAHFMVRALQGAPITMYGDGRQVRDLLYVDDLVDALLRAETGAHDLAGRAFNIGGGPENAVSLVELVDLIAEIDGATPEVRHDSWRLGDQRYYVSDTRRFQTATGWRPSVEVRTGVCRLHRWLVEERPTLCRRKDAGSAKGNGAVGLKTA